MGDINLAGAAWSFVGTNLIESANVWRALGIEAMDLLAMAGTQVDSAAIEEDPDGQARRFKESGIELSNLLYIFGEDFADRAINSKDSTVRQRNTETLKKVLGCCNSAGIKSLLILPGVDQEGMSHEDSKSLSAEVLNEMTSVAAAAGIPLTFEPHVEGLLEDPREVLEFMQQNPDLRIALDYAHFSCQGYKMADVDPLVPYAGHFHLRQGSSTQIQARWEEGEIDFRAAVGMLKEAGYQGYLTLEYEHEPHWREMDKCDVMTESIKMRDAVAPLI
jgi:sugar phosphate isomerase/epimerase